MGKKRKCYFNNNTNQAKKANLKFGNNQKIGPGLKGFLITYNCKFTFVINESKKIIQQFLSSEELDSITSGDIEKLLKAELNDLNVLDKELKVLDTGAKYTIFIGLKNSDPNKVAEAIFGHIAEIKRPLGRYVQRMLPVLSTCKSYLEDIDNCIKNTLDRLDEVKRSDSSLGDEIAQPFSYCCIFKSSNNGSICRDDVFKLVGAFLHSKNKSNKVDFDKPNFVLVINVICNVCYISFVKNYFEYKKYNLVEHGSKYNSQITTKISANTSTDGNKDQITKKSQGEISDEVNSEDENSEDEKKEPNEKNIEINIQNIE